jgi:hypothetical protein
MRLKRRNENNVNPQSSKNSMRGKAFDFDGCELEFADNELIRGTHLGRVTIEHLPRAIDFGAGKQDLSRQTK